MLLVHRSVVLLTVVGNLARELGKSAVTRFEETFRTH